MEAITKKDLKTLALMIDYDMKPNFETRPVMVDEEGEPTTFDTYFCFNALEVRTCVILSPFNSVTELMVEHLAGITPEEGTPNSAMTDEDKGLIQLLFEIEKATN